MVQGGLHDLFLLLDFCLPLLCLHLLGDGGQRALRLSHFVLDQFLLFLIVEFIKKHLKIVLNSVESVSR